MRSSRFGGVGGAGQDDPDTDRNRLVSCRQLASYEPDPYHDALNAHG